MEPSTVGGALRPDSVRLEFAYDGQGRRISKKVYSWSGAAWVLGTSTRFLHDGWNLLAELNALNSNAVVCTYVWGMDLSGSSQGAGGVGGLLFSNFSLPSTNSYASAYDGNGNVIGLVDMATGVKSATYDYNAFGETIQSDGAASATNHFRFSTKYTDDETGLIYYGYRFYQPTTGRWLSRDPIEENGGTNLYGFVGNNGISRVDPLGLLDGYAPYGFGPIGPMVPGGYTPRPPVPDWANGAQNFSANAESMITQVRKYLPGAEGGFSPISWTFVWVPYPGGRWSVDATVTGSMVACKYADGRKGLMADISIEISTQAGFGYGAGGNQGLSRAGKNKLRDRNGRYAKNHEKGLGGPEAEGELSSECKLCENTLDGSITIEIGGKAGAYLSVNPYANVAFAFSDPVSFDYGVRAGLSGYIGAELYLKASAEGSGTLIIK